MCNNLSVYYMIDINHEHDVMCDLIVLAIRVT